MENIYAVVNARSLDIGMQYQAGTISTTSQRSSSGTDPELIKAIEHLASRPVYTDLYIGSRKIAEATAQDMTQAQQQEAKLKNMINGVKSA